MIPVMITTAQWWGGGRQEGDAALYTYTHAQSADNAYTSLSRVNRCNIDRQIERDGPRVYRVWVKWFLAQYFS